MSYIHKNVKRPKIKGQKTFNYFLIAWMIAIAFLADLFYHEALLSSSVSWNAPKIANIFIGTVPLI